MVQISKKNMENTEKRFRQKSHGLREQTIMGLMSPHFRH